MVDAKRTAAENRLVVYSAVAKKHCMGLLDQERRRKLLRRWQAAVAGLTPSLETPLTGGPR